MKRFRVEVEFGDGSWQDSGEGPWESRAEAEGFAEAEVGAKWRIAEDVAERHVVWIRLEAEVFGGADLLVEAVEDCLDAGTLQEPITANLFTRGTAVEFTSSLVDTCPQQMENWAAVAGGEDATDCGEIPEEN